MSRWIDTINLLLLLSGLLFSSISYAAGQTEQEPGNDHPASTQQGLEAFKQRFYFGVGLSHSDITNNEVQLKHQYNLSPQSQLESNANGLKLFSGFKIDRHLALELSLADNGEIISSDNGLKQSLFSVNTLALDAILSQPLSSNLNAFVRLGSFYADLYRDSSENSPENSNGLHYGLGIDYNLYGSRNRQLRLEWERFDFNDIYLQEADSISLSLVFNF